jgi:hypothetical protein
MMLEKKGTIFDFCVKELYREVDYEVIQEMERDNVSPPAGFRLEG